jgi:hypothetical protein
LRFKANPCKQFSIPYLEKILHKKGAVGVPQGVGPEFKPQYHKKKKKKKEALEGIGGKFSPMSYVLSEISERHPVSICLNSSNGEFITL